MFDHIKKVALTHLKLEYPTMILVVLSGIATGCFSAVRPELAYIVEPASALLLFVALVVRTPFAIRRQNEALKNA